MADSLKAGFALSVGSRTAESGNAAWMDIESETFRNWANEVLLPLKVRINDLEKDLADGVILSQLIGAVQKKPITGIAMKPTAKHQQLSNIALSLDALKRDGVKLVNIGPNDIHDGNGKIILGLFWSTILKYQFADIAPKKWMIIWCNSVIPDMNISNLTTDWNSGVLLCGLLNFCKPSLSPDWKTLSASDRKENCRKAIEAAEKNFKIPRLISPENMSNENLDDFSMLTYLSYFTRAPDGPGYLATLRCVNSVVTNKKINNFSGDWKDGTSLCAYVASLGGNVQGWPLEANRLPALELLQAALDSGKADLREPELLSAKEIAGGRNYLGMMAYVARLHNAAQRNKDVHRKRSTPVQSAPPPPQTKRMSQPPAVPPKPTVNQPRLVSERKETTVGQPIMCLLNNVQPTTDRKSYQIAAVTVKSGAEVPCSINWSADKAIITLTPNLAENFSLAVRLNGKDINGSPMPYTVKSIPPPQLRLRVPQFSPVNRQCEVNVAAEDESSSLSLTSTSKLTKLPPGLTIEAVSPRSETLQIPIDIARSTASFKPNLVGKWRLNLHLNGKILPTPGKNVVVYNLDDVQITQKEPEPGDQYIVGKSIVYEVDIGDSVFTSASAETTRIGERGVNEQVDTLAEIAAKTYLFFITPSQSGKHQLRIDFENGAVAAQGSPFEFTVVDPAESCHFEEVGDWSSIARNAVVEFLVRGTAETDPVNVEVLSPSNKHLAPQRSRFDREKGGHLIAVVPTESGDHRIEVRVNDVVLRDMPHVLSVVRTSINAVANDPLYVGSEAIINIDTRNLRMDSRLLSRVTNPSGGDVAVIVHRRADGSTLLRFIPEESGRHSVQIFCDNQEVGDIPFYCNVIDINQLKVECESVYQVNVYQKAWYKFSFSGVNEHLVRALVEDPQGNLIPFEMQKVETNSFLIQYVPTRIGEYRVRISYNNKNLESAMRYCNAYDARKVLLLNTDTTGTAGNPMSFTVDTKEAGDPDFIVAEVFQALNGVSSSNEANPNRRPVEVQKIPVGPLRHRYQFTPLVGGDYVIDVKFFGERIQECPIAVKVFDGTNTQMRVITGGHVPVRQQDWVIIETPRVRIDPALLGIRLTGPDSSSVPCKAAIRYDENIVMEFRPLTLGLYHLHIEVCKQPVRGSPFAIQVYDASKVVVSKIEPTLTGNLATFEVDTTQAGEAPVIAQVFNPQNQPIHCVVTPVNSLMFHCQFTPTEPGEHLILVGHGDYLVPGCPFKQLVRSIQLPTPRGDGLFKGEKNVESSFVVDCKGITGDLKVTIESPFGDQISSKIDVDTATSVRTVRYTPTEAGEHKISLHWDTWSVPGSPFVAKVLDVSAVRLVSGIPAEFRHTDTAQTGKSVWRVQIEEDRELEFDVTDAGPGRLSVTVRSQSQNLPVNIEQLNDETFVARFRPVVEGEYTIEARWNELLVSSFPIRFVARNLDALREAEQDKVILSGRGLREARCNQIAQFQIAVAAPVAEPPLAHLMLDDSLDGVERTGTLVAVQIEQVDAKTFSCSYQPLVPGDYQLHIEVNGQPVRGSPLPVNVFDIGDANYVVLVNDGEPRTCNLKDEYRATVDVMRAGPGELTGFARGPAGEDGSCRFEEVGTLRYEFIMKPQVAGHHYVTIQFNGQDIPGCPLDLKVVGPPDASKVLVYGPGIQDSPLISGQQFFSCDTRGAGSAELSISASGPAGPVPVDVQMTSAKQRVAQCSYTATVPGVYFINVMWGNEHVTNSPFTVNRFEEISERTNGYSNGHAGLLASADDLTLQLNARRAEQNPNFLLGSRPSNFWSPDDAIASSRL